MQSSALLFADAYQQLAAISAVLGGLAFTAAAALLASAVTSREAAFVKSAQITVASAVASAVSLVVAALVWSLMAADLNRAAARQEVEIVFSRLNMFPSFALIAGVAFLFASVGASGWIASKKLGWCTTAIAVVGGTLAAWALWTFSEIR